MAATNWRAMFPRRSQLSECWSRLTSATWVTWVGLSLAGTNLSKNKTSGFMSRSASLRFNLFPSHFSCCFAGIPAVLLYQSLVLLHAFSTFSSHQDLEKDISDGQHFWNTWSAPSAYFPLTFRDSVFQYSPLFMFRRYLFLGLRPASWWWAPNSKRRPNVWWIYQSPPLLL